MTLVVMESTADGVGSFFHEEWGRACCGKSDKRPVFVPWHEIARYSLSFPPGPEGKREAERLGRTWTIMNAPSGMRPD